MTKKVFTVIFILSLYFIRILIKFVTHVIYFYVYIFLVYIKCLICIIDELQSNFNFSLKPYVKFFYSGGKFLQNIQLLQNEYIYKCANIWWDFIFFLQLKFFRPFLRFFFSLNDLGPLVLF